MNEENRMLRDGLSTLFIVVTALMSFGCGSEASVQVAGGAAQIALDCSSADVTEGDPEMTEAVFAVTLSVPRDEPLTVEFQTASDTAVAGEDYEDLSGSLVFAPGETEQQIRVPILDDTTVEGNETFTLTVSTDDTPPDTNQCVATIFDDDRAPTLQVSCTSINEGDPEVTDAVFTVTLEEAQDKPVMVEYETVNTTDDMAVPGEDYEARSGSLTFAPGETEQQVGVPILDDKTVEGDETFTLTVSTVSTPSATSQCAVTIVNDDMAPALQVSCTSVKEGDSETRNAVFTVTLIDLGDEPVTADFETMDATAVAGEDYEARAGSLTFAPGEMIQEVIVSIWGDTEVEPDETFSLAVTIPSETQEGLGHIVDDDTSMVFSKGVGLDAGEDSGQIVLGIPESTPIRAFLTWQQIADVDVQADNVDDTITLTVTDRSGLILEELEVLGTRSSDGPRRHGFFADISASVFPGCNTYTVSGVDNRINPGAGMVVITSAFETLEFDQGSLPGQPLATVAEFTADTPSGAIRRVEVKAGCDFFYKSSSEVITFDCDPSPVDRKAKVTLLVGDAQSTERNCPDFRCRANEILYLSDPEVDAAPSSLEEDPRSFLLGAGSTGFIATDGPFWDTFGANSGVSAHCESALESAEDLRGVVSIPAGATFASFQLVSPLPRGISAHVSMAVLEVFETREEEKCADP